MIRAPRNNGRRSQLKKCRTWLRKEFRRVGMSRWQRASKGASACGRATSIPWDIRACRATREEESGQSIAITVCFCFTIPTRCSSVRDPSTCTRFAFPRVSCGDNKLHRRILCTLICGMTILNQPESIRQSEGLAILPSLPRDEGGPVFAEPWQAQAFALAVRLSAQGHFTWSEWAAALAEELKAAANRGGSCEGRRPRQH